MPGSVIIEIEEGYGAVKINYDILSDDYDLTRNINIDVLEAFFSKVNVENSSVLDFGCGTGNYACAFKRLTSANVFGVEPSDGMRQRALDKNGGVGVFKGDHTSVPFENNFFDFIYMTDVIHHVPDLAVMFAELSRVLKPGGLVCVLTESHRQIETWFWSAYFPGTVEVEKKRYPDIGAIVSEASSCGFGTDEITETDQAKKFLISLDFLTLVEKKGFSMFRLISDESFEDGLAKLRSDFRLKREIVSNHGETLLWLKKPLNVNETSGCEKAFPPDV